MPINFPTSIDNFSNNTDNVDTIVAQDVNDLNDAVEALEAKVGADSSAVATSLDYIVKNTTSGHDHDGADSKKVIATNLNPTGLTASQLLRVNSGGTAIESAGYTVSSLLQLMMPVGYIYTSKVSTNPNTLFGFGTWVQIAQGMVLVGQKTSDADFNVAGETGGAKVATLAETNLAAHTHTGASHTHTATTGAESADHSHSGTTSGRSAAHTHGIPQGSGTTSSGYAASTNVNDEGNISSGTESADHTHTITTGGRSAAHTHSLTSDASGTGATSSSGSGTSFSIMNPYEVVYYFERTV